MVLRRIRIVVVVVVVFGGVAVDGVGVVVVVVDAVLLAFDGTISQQFCNHGL